MLTAKQMPEASISVFDAGLPPFGDRTFFLPNGTWETWQDLGVWQFVADTAHPIKGLITNFANCFGGLRLSGDDCLADLIGYSFAEREFITQLRNALNNLPNIHLHEPARITHADRDGLVCWQQDDTQREQSFDIVAVCGLPYQLLTKLGFSYDIKYYPQTALVTTLEDAHSENWAYERILQRGAATLIPRRNGWGHILLQRKEIATDLANLSDVDYLHTLQNNNWLHLRDNKLAIINRGEFSPTLRKVRNPGLGRLALLGASACSVHPIGAQELNLGLRDALVFADFAKQPANIEDRDCGRAFAELRVAERANIARLTDKLACLLDWSATWKLPVAGIAATAVGLCPALRNYLLGSALYHGQR